MHFIAYGPIPQPHKITNGQQILNHPLPNIPSKRKIKDQTIFKKIQTHLIFLSHPKTVVVKCTCVSTVVVVVKQQFLSSPTQISRHFLSPPNNGVHLFPANSRRRRKNCQESESSALSLFSTSAFSSAFRRRRKP